MNDLVLQLQNTIHTEFIPIDNLYLGIQTRISKIFIKNNGIKFYRTDDNLTRKFVRVKGNANFIRHNNEFTKRVKIYFTKTESEILFEILNNVYGNKPNFFKKHVSFTKYVFTKYYDEDHKHYLQYLPHNKQYSNYSDKLVWYIVVNMTNTFYAYLLHNFNNKIIKKLNIIFLETEENKNLYKKELDDLINISLDMLHGTERKTDM